MISPGASWLPTPLELFAIMNGCGVVLADTNTVTGIFTEAMPVEASVNDPLYDPGARFCGFTATLSVPGVAPLLGETVSHVSLIEATVKFNEPAAGFEIVTDCAGGDCPVPAW